MHTTPAETLIRDIRLLGLTLTPDMVACDMQKQQVTFASGVVRQATERYTRAMGYHRPVNYFNPGKRQEHADRVLFKESRIS